jgi:5-methylcytosine-specific restriction protein B
MKSFAEYLASIPNEEGFSAGTEQMSVLNANGMRFVLLYSDIYSSLELIWAAGSRLSDALSGVWDYNEDSYREALKPILNVNGNSVTPNIQSQTGHTVRSLELYASFLLDVPPSQKTRRGRGWLFSPENLAHEKLDKIITYFEIPFKKWLSPQVSESSLDKYLSALKSAVSRNAGLEVFRKDVSRNLFNALERASKSDEIRGLNERGGNMYGAAINHYKRFLEGQPADVTISIKNEFSAICDFAKEYNQASGAWLTSEPKCLAACASLEKMELWARSHFELFRGIPIQFKFGKGSGNFPKVPWLCLLPPGQTAKNGIYVSICFGSEGAGAVCGFAGSAATPQGLAYADLGENPPIDANTFNHGFVNPENFFKDSFDEEKLRSHIADSLSLCLDQLKLLSTSMFTSDDKDNVAGAVKATGFQTEDGLVDRVLDSLAAKPFLILTGNSGTGKTKLAELVASRLSGKDCHVTMAVGAGWTDNRNVIGFVNFLRSDSANGEGDDVSQPLPLYQSTPILDLLLRADRHPAEPHFLILDEMNLSHVERYFADFLSAMESTKGLINLHSEGDEETLLSLVAGGEPVVPRRLPFPKNVFVIGTVNVDETTYMFSPKVLDRANVIEFRTGKTQIGQFLSDGGSVVSEITLGGESEQRGFLQLAKAVRSGTVEPLDAGATRSIGEALAAVFDIMADARLEFGFRTIKEIISYHAADHALSANKTEWKWEPIFDLQLLQKVLPKLHGSKRRLEALLLRLASFCETGTVPPKDATYPDDLSASGAVKYPWSRAKLVEMIEAVRRDQFVSFIH